MLLEQPLSHFDVRCAEASSAIVHHVSPEHVEQFLDWQNGITAAIEQFPGYRGSELYPPADDGHDQWVVVFHFVERASLAAWLGSPERAEWVQRLDRSVADYHVKRLDQGFAPWFEGDAATPTSAPPPGWKMALSVLLGLYPTVMLLTIFVAPYTNRLGLAVSMLIGNALSVSILQWLVMPMLTRALRPWLEASEASARRGRTIAVAVGGVCVLVGLAALFRIVAR